MTYYKRHDRSSIYIHWFNALCWFLLLLTGLGIVKPEYNPLGAWYPELLRSLFGGGAGLLVFHEIVGLAWIAGFILYLLVNMKGAAYFLKEVFSVSPNRDIAWMLKKMVVMTLGPKALRNMGQTPDLPEQGFYNMGQKAFAQASVLGGVGIAATGMIMFLSDRALGAEATVLIGWSITLHYLAVGLVFAGLLVHIYMAAISPEEQPGFKSMFTGTVPEDYAKHHHSLWWKELKNRETA